MQAEVTASIEKARNEPKNFDAQLKAAELYYQIQRYDQSIEYLLKANQLKPTDYQTVVTLGMVNLDAGHYDTAEKWYRAAMKMKPDDVAVLAGMNAFLLIFEFRLLLNFQPKHAPVLKCELRHRGRLLHRAAHVS